MSIEALYGAIPFDTIAVAAAAVQLSPRSPGSAALEDLAPASVDRFVMLVPPTVLERRRALALALRALRPGGDLIALGPNTRGGTRIADELAAFGCPGVETHKRHHRIVQASRPATLHELDAAIEAGAPRLLADLGLWSEPGLFNWDSIDPGSRLLLDHLPVLEGRGADLGCGIGVLARAVLAHPECRHLTLIDIDRRALDLARRNVARPEATSGVWTDLRRPEGLPSGLDFVVMNPPFHDGGQEDRELGSMFIARAAGMLRPGGALWLTANRHLPYEAPLRTLFADVAPIADARGFKVYAARKATGARGQSSDKPRDAGRSHGAGQGRGSSRAAAKTEARDRRPARDEGCS